MGFLKHAVVASIAAGLIAPAASHALAAPTEEPAPAVPASAVPASAASAPVASVGKPPPKGDLAGALLTDEDLPKGWASFDAALMGGMLPGALDPNRLGGDPCELPAPPPLKDQVKDTVK